MRFFHLSDLHLGLKLFNRDMCADQEHILRQVVACAAERRPDAVVVAGDIYDRAVPSAEAVGLFDRFLSELAEAVPESEIMLISGNHDSAVRTNLFRSILQKEKIHMIGMPPQNAEDHIETVTLADAYGPVRFYLLPFVKPSMVRRLVSNGDEEEALSYNESLHRLLARETIDPNIRSVLVSHQFYLPFGVKADEVPRMESEITTVGNIDAVDADLLEAFDYAALGHIHRAMSVGSPRYRYAGTPLACSVSEAGQEKGMLEVTLGEKGSVQTELLPLLPLHAVRVVRGKLGEVLEQSCEDYVSVVLTETPDSAPAADAAETERKAPFGEASAEDTEGDPRDLLRAAFPNLLEIRMETPEQADYAQASELPEEAMDPFSLCCAFLHDPDEEDREILRDVINSTREVNDDETD